jgi:hypothetical protein
MRLPTRYLVAAVVCAALLWYRFASHQPDQYGAIATLEAEVADLRRQLAKAEIEKIPPHFRDRSAVKAQADLLEAQDLRWYEIGDTTRVRNMLIRDRQGQHTNIVMIGGSVTAGGGSAEGALPRGGRGWPTVVEGWARSHMNNASVNVVAFGGMGCGYFSLCTQPVLNLNPDLVVIDTTVNDIQHACPMDESGKCKPQDINAHALFENLVRTLLSSSPTVAVVVMVNRPLFYGSPGDLNVKSRTADHHVSVARYYQVPMVRYDHFTEAFASRAELQFAAKGAHKTSASGPWGVQNAAMSSSQGLEGSSLLSLFDTSDAWPNCHPNALGHTLMGHCLIHLLQFANLQLSLDPTLEGHIMTENESPPPQLPPRKYTSMGVSQSTCSSMIGEEDVAGESNIKALSMAGFQRFVYERAGRHDTKRSLMAQEAGANLQILVNNTTEVLVIYYSSSTMRKASLEMASATGIPVQCPIITLSGGGYYHNSFGIEREEFGWSDAGHYSLVKVSHGCELLDAQSSYILNISTHDMPGSTQEQEQQHTFQVVSVITGMRMPPTPVQPAP